MDSVKRMSSPVLPNYISGNNHHLTFTNKQQEWGLSRPSLPNGAVYADLDNDGDLDLVVNNINENAFVYQNLAADSGKAYWLQVQLKGRGANTFAIGAKVYVYGGGQLQYQEVNPTRGYLSCVSTVLKFG